ncbi:helix-turn-helix transcriptional regulator [Tropicimonas sp. TH_r6]|uniref:helix-turn-helix transcriptional regulator n=1 Tax=Tropicimonas sp. TH_r6 TaxID=3082085 RepID=UPI00295516CB|nr:helix-turn-helix transcriptional regulator [Tropicimonas sp. TH_r6]MDV7143134.1 helix-turn-helix transcriptional regulator [Tropicimonas sp. TH_r6]
MKRETSHLSGDARDEAIERLYDVALDPSRYESLVDIWEEALKPLREQADFSSPRLLDDPAISSHFRRADAFLDRVDSASAKTQMAQALAPFDKVAAFLFDETGMVNAANPAAFQTLDLTAGVALATIAINPDDIGSITAAARTVFAGEKDNAAVLRVRSRERGHFVVLRLQVTTLGDGARHILAASSEVSCPEGFSDILRRAFDLTGAEASVVQRLVECCSVKEIAEQRGRSIDTVRAQIKSILSKTETRSQVELVRLALSIMDMSNLTLDVELAPRIVSRGYATLDERPFETLDTPDGRRLDYLCLGDPKGAPVFYLPGDYGLVRLPASAEREAAARGMKIIVPIRAGYGMSTMLAPGQDYFETFYEDAGQILAAEGAERCPILTTGDDFYAAVKLANRYPGRFTALVAAAGVLPMTRREQFERMEKWHRFIIAGSKYTPHLQPFMVKAGFYLARKIGKRGFIHAVYGNSQADIETFEDAEAFEAIVTGSEVALTEDRSAHDAFSRMMLGEKTEDWSDAVHALREEMPIIFLNGTQDPQVPLATLDEFRRDYDWIDFRVFEDGGQLILFRHWRSALDDLEKNLSRSEYTPTGV